jgi:hypothetical protein
LRKERNSALARGEAVDRYLIARFYGAPTHALLGWIRRGEIVSANNKAAVKIKV